MKELRYFARGIKFQYIYSLTIYKVIRDATKAIVQSFASLIINIREY